MGVPYEGFSFTRKQNSLIAGPVTAWLTAAAWREAKRSRQHGARDVNGPFLEGTRLIALGIRDLDELLDCVLPTPAFQDAFC